MNPADRIWTPKSILDWTEEFFSSKGIPSPRLDAELLLAHVLRCQRIDLYLKFDRPLDSITLAEYRQLVRQRAERRPLAYLTGETGFWNLSLKIAEGVLIPSPDSEILVEAILAAITEMRAELRAEFRGESRTGDSDAPLSVLELGTGSAALPLAVCSEARNIRWVAVERSPEGMAIARENARAHAALLEPRGNALHLFLGDRFQAIHPGWRPHIVAGNPPYIPSGTIDRLMPEVSRAEPRMALDGGRDGGDFQRYMLEYAARALQPGGRVLMEIGAEQSPSLKAWTRQHGRIELVEFRKDLGGHPRVFHGKMPG